MKTSKKDQKRGVELNRIVSLPENTICFDCGQKGVSYADMTVGSFVCIKCSGVLRGLVPPHRLKSVSICMFSDAEIEFLKERGNKIGKKIYGNSIASQTDIRNPKLMKTFMTAKYSRQNQIDDLSAKDEMSQKMGSEDKTNKSTRTNDKTSNLLPIHQFAAKFIDKKPANEERLRNERRQQKMDDFKVDEKDGENDDLVKDTLDLFRLPQNANKNQTTVDPKIGSLLAQDLEELFA